MAVCFGGTYVTGCFESEPVIIKQAPTVDIEYSFKHVGHAYPLIRQLVDELDGEDLVVINGDGVFNGCTDRPLLDAVIAGISDPHFTPGNHDTLINCPENVHPLAQPFEMFMRNGDQFILIDSTIDPWNITVTQFNQLQNAFSQPARNRFVFTHFALHVEDPVFDFSNNQWLPNSNANRPPAGQLRFETEVRPILESQPNVFMFFGDYGNHNNGYHQQVINGVTYTGSGLSARDAAVESAYDCVDILADGSVNIRMINLNCPIPDAEKANPSLCVAADAGNQGMISGLTPSCSQVGSNEVCGVSNVSGQQICSLPFSGITFQRSTPLTSPIMGLVRLNIPGISSLTELTSITIGGVTLFASDGALFSNSNEIIWGGSETTQAQRDAIYSVLSGGRSFDLMFSCP